MSAMYVSYFSLVLLLTAVLKVTDVPGSEHTRRGVMPLMQAVELSESEYARHSAALLLQVGESAHHNGSEISQVASESSTVENSIAVESSVAESVPAESGAYGQNTAKKLLSNAPDATSVAESSAGESSVAESGPAENGADVQDTTNNLLSNALDARSVRLEPENVNQDWFNIVVRYGAGVKNEDFVSRLINASMLGTSSSISTQAVWIVVVVVGIVLAVFAIVTLCLTTGHWSESKNRKRQPQSEYDKGSDTDSSLQGARSYPNLRTQQSLPSSVSTTVWDPNVTHQKMPLDSSLFESRHSLNQSRRSDGVVFDQPRQSDSLGMSTGSTLPQPKVRR